MKIILRQMLSDKSLDFSSKSKIFETDHLLEFFNKTRPKQSAVTVILFNDHKSDNLTTIVLRRTNDGSVHAGQIGLPGGKKENTDQNLEQTALRETQEEIGIPPEQLEILGTLSDVYIPASNFVVKPFVAWTGRQPKIKFNPQEVSQIYFIPVNLLSEFNIKEKNIFVRGKSLKVKGYSINGIFIWGATAKILAELSGYLKLIL